MVYVSELMMMVGFYTRPQTHLDMFSIMRPSQKEGFQRVISLHSHEYEINYDSWRFDGNKIVIDMSEIALRLMNNPVGNES